MKDSPQLHCKCGEFKISLSNPRGWKILIKPTASSEESVGGGGGRLVLQMFGVDKTEWIELVSAGWSAENFEIIRRIKKLEGGAGNEKSL